MKPKTKLIQAAIAEGIESAQSSYRKSTGDWLSAVPEHQIYRWIANKLEVCGDGYNVYIEYPVQDTLWEAKDPSAKMPSNEIRATGKVDLMIREEKQPIGMLK